MDDTPLVVPPVKRTDVGYKRPPAEHRFTRENQPPRRRKKVEDFDPSALALLNKILAEPQRVIVNGAVTWMSNAEAIVCQALQLVESGNRTLRRPVDDLMMSVNKEKYTQSRLPRMEVDGVDIGPMAQWKNDDE